MSDCYIGEIRLFGGGYMVQGWLPCDGRLLPIMQYERLFAVLGAVWGGNGSTTFGIPNLVGRIPIGQGTGTGLTPRVLGATGGSQSAPLDVTQIPSHNHAANTQASAATTTAPTGALPAQIQGNFAGYIQDAQKSGTFEFSDTAIETAGGDQPHANIMPSLPLTYMIAADGTFPTRQ
jgi:microcystin-dependent protein